MSRLQRWERLPPCSAGAFADQPPGARVNPRFGGGGTLPLGHQLLAQPAGGGAGRVWSKVCEV